jgi:hypothetical protein
MYIGMVSLLTVATAAQGPGVGAPQRAACRKGDDSGTVLGDRRLPVVESRGGTATLLPGVQGDVVGLNGVQRVQTHGVGE